MGVLSGSLLLLAGGPDADEVPLSGPLVVGETISLHADVHVPPNGIGLKVTDSNIEIDLNGHEIVGSGTGTGISVEGQSGVVVSHGRIRGCGQGVTLLGGGQHRLTGLVVQGNQGNGIQIIGSQENRITGCRLLDNTRMGLLLQDGNTNQIQDNRVQGNRGPGDSGGITLLHSSSNEVSDNTVQRNGSWGIRLLEQSEKNRIASNLIADTSLPVAEDRDRPRQPAVVWQPGLVLNSGANGNEVRGNILVSNGDGLFLWEGATGNRIAENRAMDNYDLDLLDLNQTCAANTWSENQFGRANHRCDP